MRNRATIKDLLANFPSSSTDTVVFDEENIFMAYQQEQADQSLAIKCLSVFGGVLAALTFLGFLYFAGLYRTTDALFVFSAIMIGFAIWVSRKSDRIILDTMSITFFVIALFIIWINCMELKMNDQVVRCLYIGIGAIALILVRKYVLIFISNLLVQLGLLSVILSNKTYLFLHLYIAYTAIVVVYLFLQEANILTRFRSLSYLYRPVKVGMIFSLLSGLFFLSIKAIKPTYPVYSWISSLILISALLYVLYAVFKQIGFIEKKQQILWISILVISLLPTIGSPAIAGSLLILLLSFYIHYTVGIGLGIIALIYSVAQFYYDLTFSLMTKSILLLASGLFFLVLYFLSRRKFEAI